MRAITACKSNGTNLFIKTNIMEEPRILCIHGIGGKDATINDWGPKWRNSFKSHLNLTNDKSVQFMEFDAFFKGYNAGPADYIKFLAKSFIDLLKDRRSRKSVKDWMDNYPDMVVEFYQESGLRQDLRQALKNHLGQFRPNIIYAHSLGSLMCYDFFVQNENNDAYKDVTLVTAGSQLGNKFLRGHITYPYVELPIKQWYNLNNDKDMVFARPDIQMNFKNFKQIETYFDDNMPINHDGLRYLNHEKAVSEVWKVCR